MSGSGVASACFGHMVAAVWDGSAVRQQNKDRLERCLAVSVAEHGNDFSARGSAPDFFVCPPCYNDYHDLARVSKFHDTGYLGRQGEASLWPCGPAAAPEALL